MNLRPICGCYIVDEADFPTWLVELVTRIPRQTSWRNPGSGCCRGYTRSLELCNSFTSWLTCSLRATAFRRKLPVEVRTLMDSSAFQKHRGCQICHQMDSGSLELYAACRLQPVSVTGLLAAASAVKPSKSKAKGPQLNIEMIILSTTPIRLDI